MFGYCPPAASTPKGPTPTHSYSVLSSAGVWWYVTRSGLVSWLSQRANGAAPTWTSVGGSPLNHGPGLRPEDWSRDEVERALAELLAGRDPGMAEVS